MPWMKPFQVGNYKQVEDSNAKEAIKQLNYVNKKLAEWNLSKYIQEALEEQKKTLENILNNS